MAHKCRNLRSKNGKEMKHAWKDHVGELFAAISSAKIKFNSLVKGIAYFTLDGQLKPHVQEHHMPSLNSSTHIMS